MSRDPGARRRSPPWWDHQRHVLVALRAAVERAVGELGPLEARRVVDLGSGDAPYAPLFRRRGCEYVTCDLDGAAEVRIEAGRPVALPSGSAAGVVSFQVLEHVWDLDWYLGECARLLAPGGWLLLSTHGAWLYHPHPTDFRRWTRDGLVRELEERGFAVERVEPLVGPLAWTTQFRLLGMREALRKVPLLGALALPPLACAMNLRMALEEAITPAAARRDNACVYLVLARPAPRR
ncbi:MAG TPA: class I SAM-dependent methyltransferase [Thermoanaerobaculia bacterium]|nr:class I SAM-dependent methyltransferase [Thermoanaerobaculia bacterium]